MGITRYDNDTDIQRADRLLGTNSSTGRTANFRIGDIVDYIQDNNGSGLNGSITTTSGDEVIPLQVTSDVEHLVVSTDTNFANRTIGFTSTVQIEFGSDFSDLFTNPILSTDSGLLLRSNTTDERIQLNITSIDTNNRTIDVSAVSTDVVNNFSPDINKDVIVFTTGALTFTGNVDFSSASVVGIAGGGGAGATRGATLPENGSFGQRFYLNADYAIEMTEAIMSNGAAVTYTSGLFNADSQFGAGDASTAETGPISRITWSAARNAWTNWTAPPGFVGDNNADTGTLLGIFLEDGTELVWAAGAGANGDDLDWLRGDFQGDADVAIFARVSNIMAQGWYAFSDQWDFLG